MTIEKTIDGTEATLAIEGWLDTNAAPELLKALDELESDTESLVLDLKKLEYISSSGVRGIVSAYKKMNGAIKVRGAAPGIMSIFKATGIDKKISFE
ncbi:MAG: STAS domain-containing protein [Lachnospiraceae bacterium]|nr:STAS domain-containing protein [Lachnospiraceae bacterium]MBQ6258703.1 STAS domain-containing protein [Lachnospiraceae bacterium]